MLPQDLDLASNNEVISTASICDYGEWHEMTQNIDSYKLSLLTINERSLPGKYALLCANLSRIEKKFTFIVVVETLLTNDKDRSLELNGYKSHSLYRSNQVGGGIKLCYLDFISANIIHEFAGIG